MASRPPETQPTSKCDVAILGGGLAGLSLAIQLHRARPNTSVTVFEKRTWPVPEAAHKVGESLLQIGAYYFDQICAMRPHLERDQLPKMGLRFFFPGGGGALEERVEVGLASWVDHAPTYQLDRGRFENALADEAAGYGVDLRPGMTLVGVERLSDGDVGGTSDGDAGGASHGDVGEASDGDLGGARYRLTTRDEDGELHVVLAAAVVDASGRAAILKRKFGLGVENTHHCNAAWFRIGRRIMVDDWCEEPAWQARVPHGTRWQSTNHFMGPGYWFWVIPLASDSTSFGLVADPDLVPFEAMRRFEPLLEWLHQHEPVAAEIVEHHRDALQDFRTLKHYSHGCEQVFSPDGWYISGEAGVFLDPLYSPGSDAIAIANTMITRLIAGLLDGEDVTQAAEMFNGLYLLISGRLLSIWDHQYPLFGSPEVTAAKIAWDFLGYFGSLALLSVAGRLDEPEFLVTVLPHVNRISELNHNMQEYLREWADRTSEADAAGYPCMSESTYHEMEEHIATSPSQDADWVRERIVANAARIEAAAVEIMTRSAAALGVTVDPDNLDPCTFRLPGSEREAEPVTTTASPDWRSAGSGFSWATAEQPRGAAGAAYSVWLPEALKAHSGTPTAEAAAR